MRCIKATAFCTHFQYSTGLFCRFSCSNGNGSPERLSLVLFSCRIPSFFIFASTSTFSLCGKSVMSDISRSCLCDVNKCLLKCVCSRPQNLHGRTGRLYLPEGRTVDLYCRLFFVSGGCAEATVVSLSLPLELSGT